MNDIVPRLVLAGHDRMIETLGGKEQAGWQILWLQVRKLRENLLRSQACTEQRNYIGHANAHTPNARTTTALLRVDGNAVKWS